MKISYSQAAALEVVTRAQSESELWVMLHNGRDIEETSHNRFI